MEKVDFANVIIKSKARRRQLGLTRYEMAWRCGVREPTLDRWERGTTLPNIGRLYQLERAFECNIHDLIVLEEENNG